MSSNIKIPKVCQFCGKDYIAKTTVTKYCSDNCAKRAYKQRKKEEKIRNVKPVAVQRKEFNQTQLKDKEFLSIAETCELLGISRMTLNRLRQKEIIFAAKIGGRVIIKRSEIEKLFKL